MTHHIDNTITMKNEGIYIVNEQHEIVKASGIFKNMYGEGLHNKKCYKVMRGNDKPCEDCPLNSFDRNKQKSVHKILYNQILKCWLDSTMVPVHWPKQGECMLITCKEITHSYRDTYVNYNQKTEYAEFVEIDIDNNYYKFIHYDRNKINIPLEGNLHEFLETFCFEHVYPEDQKDFLAFWDLSTLISRVNKVGNITEDFRILYTGHGYYWFSFVIHSAKKMIRDTLLRCSVNIGRKYVEPAYSEDELYQMLDPLTGIYNNEAFLKLTRKRLQDDGDDTYGIIRIDIENFMLFNDWYSTKEGDKLLLYLASKIKEIAEPVNGIPARIGSDDFVILMPQSYCSCEFLEKKFINWMQDYDVNVKFIPAGGIYLIDDCKIAVTLMCDRASLALKTVKGNYSLRVAMYDKTMKQRLSNEQEVLFDVKKGLDKHEFEVYYQPQCSARTSCIIGAEALVRWNHPQKGFLPPNEFIPILERSGFISKLDYYVWEEVCRFQHVRKKNNLNIVPISVNVSRMDIYQYHIAEVFLAFTKKYELEPRLIEIEITESAYSEDFNHLMEEIRELRSYGFIVLMDDFGSGYSSLNMLKDIEIDVLKIDMKFLEINEYSASRSNGILESIIQMGKWLGLRLIAEGVETKEQADNLLNLDCEYMQGYYFYRPMSQQQFEDILNEDTLVDMRGILAHRLPSIKLDDLFHKDITSEGMLSNILGGIALYELSSDDHLTIKMVNDNYYRMTGCNSVDLFERSEHIIDQVHPEDLEIFWDIFKRAEKAGSLGANGTFRRFRLNGEIMWMHLHAFYLRKQGDKKLFYGSVSDFSKSMGLQKELIRLLETIPGNIIEYGIKNDKMVYHHVISAGLADVIGMNKESYKRILETLSTFDLIVQEDREYVSNIMKNPSTWKDHSVIEYRAFNQNGEIIWIEQHLKFIEQEDEVNIYIQWSTDITLLKKRESELLESQKILHKILGITNNSISHNGTVKENAAYLISHSLQGGILGFYLEGEYPLYFANDEILRLLNYESYQELCQTCNGQLMNLIHEQDRKHIVQNLNVTFEADKEYTLRCRILKKDGTSVWTIINGRFLKGEGRKDAMICFCMDITELMSVEMKLKEARESVTMLNALIPGGYYQCQIDKGYSFIHISDRFCEMLGFTKEEIASRFHNSYKNMIFPADRNRLIHDTMNNACNCDHPFVGQYRIYTHDGMMWIRNQICMIQYEDTQCYAGIIQNINDIVMMQEKIHGIIYNTPGDVFSIEKGKLIYHSYNLCKDIGYTIEEYQAIVSKDSGSSLTDIRDRLYVHETVQKALKSHKNIDLVFRAKSKSNDLRYIHMKATWCGEYMDEPLYYGIMIDVTASIVKEHELNISQQVFESIIHQANLNVWEYDVIKDELMLSVDALHLISDQIPSVFKLQDGNYYMHDFKKCMENKTFFSPKTYHVLSLLKESVYNEKGSDLEIDLSIYDNVNCWIKITCEGICNNDGEVVKVIGYFQNITKEVEKEVIAKEELHYAQFDSLTGIYNRRMGEILIQNALIQQKHDHLSALMLIDIDDFKQINDQYGHITGDHVLKSVANCIKNNLRDNDIFCRLGGDEFLIYSIQNSTENILKLASRVHNSVIVKNKCANHPLKGCEISIGIAISPLHGDDWMTLYKKADIALYKAKAEGKSQSFVYDENMSK